MGALDKYSLIHRFGIEVEGACYPSNAVPKGWRFKSDASIRIPGHTGRELVSPPIPLRGVNEALKTLEQNYPEKTNATCGLHVHMSFHMPKATVSMLLGTVAFQNHLLSALWAWGLEDEVNITNSEFWARLKGENSYCKVVKDDEDYTSDCRYKAVNLAALERHGTVEVRVLPAFKTPALAAAAVYKVLQITCDYLSEHYKSQELSASDDVDFDDEDMGSNEAVEVVDSLDSVMSHVGYATECPSFDLLV